MMEDTTMSISQDRVALIYPPVNPECQAIRDLGLSPPLHLLALAAVLKDDVKIFDGAHESLEEILQGVKRFDPNVIGMNVDITNYENAINIADSTSARVILGGNYAAFLANQILANQPRIESICFNDGEEALAGFIEGDLSAPNLIHRGGRNISKAPSISNNLTPAYELVDMGRYFNRQKEIFGPGFKMMQFYGQKGCVNTPHCTFCGRYEDGMRLRNPEIYSEEVKRYVKKFGLTEVWDRSDSFLQSKAWFKAVHSQLKGLSVSWKTYARADQLTLENIAMMKEMGFRMVYIGYEAGDDSLLRGMNKRETAQQYLDATKRVLEAGIDIDGSFIIGLPGENKRTLENQLNFVERLSGIGLRKIKVNRVLVLPGTPLYERVCQKCPETRRQDKLDLTDMQMKLYSTYDLTDFGGVENFVDSINNTAEAMTGRILQRGGCIEGYGYGTMKVAGGREVVRV